MLLAYPIIVRNDTFYLHTMIYILFYAVMAVGLNLIMRTGQLSIGQAAFMALGAYLSVILMVKYQLSFWTGWSIMMIICGMIAWLFGFITLRIKGVNFAILTFAFGEVVRMAFSYSNYFGGVTGIQNIPSPTPIQFIGNTLLQFDNKTNYYYLVLLYGLLCLTIYYRLITSSVGQVLVSIEKADLLAECCGINTMKMKVTSFVIGSMMTSGIGSLYACYFSYISPDSFNFIKSVDLIIINVIGGVGSISGPLIGTIFLICIPELLRSLKEYEHLVFAVILILFIYFIPKGIGGAIEQALKSKLI
jgi:branched-chain amino acid transport system permease protein